MDTPSVTIPAFKYDVGTIPDIGKGMAEGIKTAGEGIAKGVTGAFDVLNRSRNADDMLSALNQSGVLSNEQYQAIAGKGLPAKEQLTGMFANQWILDQANQRQMSLEQGKGGVEVATSHAKLLDLYNQARAGNPAAIDVKKQYWQPPQSVQNPQQQPGAPQPPPGPQAQPLPQATPGQLRAGALPGTRRVQQIDNSTGKKITGTLYPSGQFIADPTPMTPSPGQFAQQ